MATFLNIFEAFGLTVSEKKDGDHVPAEISHPPGTLITPKAAGHQYR